MPSFDVTSEMNWQELDNATSQTLKEITSRFDFKAVKVEIKVDQKLKTVTLWCSQGEKLEDVRKTFDLKLIKRGLSLLSFDYQTVESAFGGSVRQVAKVIAGISKDDGKKIIAAVKDSGAKAQAQIQDEQVRVTSKSRDILQEVIGYLKSQQTTLKVPMQFGNFRD